MIRKNLFKTITILMLCTMVFAGCGKKKVTVDTSITSTESESTTETKRVAADQEQVTVSVKDADGNTVEVVGIVETKENGEKVVVVTDSDGNRTEISADGFTEDGNKTVTVSDEKASKAISSAAAEDKVPKADEIIEIPDNGNNNNGGSSDNNSYGNSSDNGGNGNNGNASVPDTPSHTHNWKPVYVSPIHHEAETHNENRWVVDKAAWDEKQVKYIEICGNCQIGNCERCKKLGITNFEYDSLEALDKHQDECLDDGGSCFSSTYRENVTYIHHDEEGHYETITIVDKEAWDEPVIDHYECDCGATK